MKKYILEFYIINFITFLFYCNALVPSTFQDVIPDGTSKVSNVSPSKSIKIDNTLQGRVLNLSEERIENLIILNDITEDLAHSADDLFFKNNNRHNKTVTGVLMNALLDDHMILCTKSVFKNYIFFATVWHDLLSLNFLKFRQKYQNKVANLRDWELGKIIRTAREINLLFSNGIPPQNTESLDHQINKILFDFPVNKWNLYHYFIFYKSYQIFKKKQLYDVYEVNDDFLLCIPKKKINQSKFMLTQFNRLSIMQNYKVFNSLEDFCNLYLGIRIPSKNVTNDLESNLLVDLKKFNQQNSIGMLLYDALEKIFFTKANFIKNNQDFEKKYAIKTENNIKRQFLLPRFNIVLIGHGSPGKYILGLYPDEIKKTLLFFNNQIWMKSLILQSCFIGGHAFEHIFQHSYTQIGAFAENIGYTILFIGSFYTVTSVKGYNGPWSDYLQEIHQKNYSKVFNYLSVGKVQYQEVLSVMQNISPLNNYGSIKFPHTGWIIANDYNKEVFTVTKVKVAANINLQNMHIPQDKKIILMNTNIIPLDVVIDRQIDTKKDESFINFLPMYYMNQNYYVSKLTIKNIVGDNFERGPIEFAYFLEAFFNLELNINEPINIIIDQVVLKEYPIYDVLIEKHHKRIYFTMPKVLGGQSYCYQVATGELIDINGSDLKDAINTLKEDIFNASVKHAKFLNKNFIKKLEANLEAKSLSKLNPKAKEFISQLDVVAN